jgi:hypothetical protein
MSTSLRRIGRFRPVRRAVFSLRLRGAPKNTTCCNGTSFHLRAFNRMDAGARTMLVERGLQVISVEVVGDAYAIASNYLRRSGAIPDNLVPNERLLAIIVELFQRGERNRIRLANKAISEFEAFALV